jgi:hypothetical protein
VYFLLLVLRTKYYFKGMKPGNHWGPIEVCTGPGLDLVAQTMFRSGPGSGIVLMIAIKRYIEHFGLSRANLFFRKEEVIRSCAHLILVTQSGCGYKSHLLDFLWDFLSCPLPEIVPDNILQTWHPISLYRSSNAKITWNVLDPH